MRERLRDSGLKLFDSHGLVDAVEEGLCDPKAQANWLSSAYQRR